MKRVLSVFLILFILFASTACTNKPIEKFSIDSKYYNSEGKYITVTSEELNNKKNESYVVFTYNNFCNLSIPCETIFESFMQKSKIDFLSIPFEDFKKTYLYDTVKYGPSVIVVKDGKVIAYLDANEDKDIEKYQDVDKFEEWISQYIKIK